MGVTPTLILYTILSSTLYGRNNGFAGLKFEPEIDRNCDVADLNVDYDTDDVDCFPVRDSNTLEEHSTCVITRDVKTLMEGSLNKTVVRKCLRGYWVVSHEKRRRIRKRRFLRRVWRGVKRVARNVYCLFFCSGGGGWGATTIITAPTFDPCRPPDLSNSYYTAPGETSVVVTWSTPVAKDSDGTVSVELSSGFASGSSFTGSVTGASHSITYKAKNKYGLTSYCPFSFKVYVRACSTAVFTSNGIRNCNANSNLGSVCTYSCNHGFELQGDSMITCQGDSSPSWSSPAPTCERVNCPVAPTMDHGSIDCASTSAGSICPITCDTNYMITGQSVIVCQLNGTWTSTEATSCSDVRPPEISCQSPQTFYADRKANSTVVTWTLPTATDLVDPNPTITKVEGPTIGSALPIGSAFVKYKATDSEGNDSGNCTIEIRVGVSTCQHPYDILQDTSLVYACDTTSYIYGTECELSCEFQYTLNGTNLITCEVDDPDNPTAVGSWSWGNAYQPHCNRIDCPVLDPPINGAITLSHVGQNAVYTMGCQEDFTIPEVISGFTGQWICQNQGTYTPAIDVPDCVEPRTPRSVSLPAEIFYYSGDCSDSATAEQIKANVLQILADSVNPIIRTICPHVNNCTTGNLHVTCGTTTVRRKRSPEACLRPYDEPIKLNNREKRQTTPTFIVEFDIIAFIVIGENQTFLAALTETDILQSDVLVPYFQSAVANGSFDITGYTLQGDSFQTPQYGNIDCDPGYKLNQIKCEPCPSGYFLNSSNECELCELGTYANVEGLASCINCPTGYTTLKNGTKNILLCKELCPVGKYSTDGVVPCTTCPIGYYQDGIGQTSCIQCDTGTTEFSGSTSSTQCQAFHLLVDNTTGIVSAGTLSTDISNVTVMFWTKLFAELNASASIRLKSGGNDRMIIYLTDTHKIQVQLPGTSYDLEMDYPFSHTWTHISVTWDTTNGELSVYLKGQLYHSDKSTTAPASPLITNGTVGVESSGTTGVYIADLHIEDAVVSAAEVQSMTTNCWIERPKDVFNMSSFRNTEVQGLRIQTPTFCDPVDECDASPCNNDVISHTCVDSVNNYTCYCIGGYTGRNCDVPPDYCIGNNCENNATCVNGNGTYTCTCLLGYTGGLCEDAPVNGGWSDWTDWTECTVTCNGGTQTRTRSCDSPVPTPYGTNCTGDSSETQSCNQDICPICPELSRGFGMLPNCTTDGTGWSICNVTCKEGYVIPDSLTTTVFECGSDTNYTWTPMPNAPDCVDPEKGSRNDLLTSIRTNNAIPSADQQAVEQAITNNLASEIPCVGNNTCQVTGVDITTARRKRSAGSTITVTLSVIMTETGALEIQDYIATSSVNPSFEELIDAINDLETAAVIINSSSSSIFDVTVNGVTYTTDSSTLTIIGNVTCPTGKVATEGVCAACPTGTYYIDGYCTFCDVGTYTTTTGQTSCTTCPSGLTTSTIGSYAASQCSETLTTTAGSGTTTTTTVTGGQNQNSNSVSKDDSDNHVMIIGIAIAAVALIIAISICGFVVYKKKGVRVASQTSLQTSRPSVSRQGTALSIGNIDYTEIDVAHVFQNPLYREPSKTRFSTHRDSTERLDYIQPCSPPPAYTEDDHDCVLPTK